MKNKKLRRHIVSGLLLVVTAVIAPNSAIANDIVVDGDFGNHCKWDEALKNHNNHTRETKRCAVGTGDDTIILDPRNARGEPEPTMFLDLNVIPIKEKLKITTTFPHIYWINTFFDVKAGASLTISGSFSDRVQADQLPPPFASFFSVNSGSTLVMEGDGSFSNHQFYNGAFGGVIFSHNGTVIIRGPFKFEHSIVTKGGGAIYSEAGGTVKISDNAVFSENSVRDEHEKGVEGQGGAIYIREGDLEIGRMSCRGNRARDGGCIFSHNSTVNITERSDFVDNEGDPAGGGRGGALTMEGGHGNITGIWHNNSSGNPNSNGCCGAGGAIYIENGSLTAHNIDCAGNKAHGGGCAYVTHANFTLSDSDCLINSAFEGGCLVTAGDSDNLVISNSTIGSNSATKNSRGGGMLLFNTNASMFKTQIVENSAGQSNDGGKGQGGGIFGLTSNQSFPTKIAISNSTVAHNTASVKGAAIELEKGSTLTAVNSTFGDQGTSGDVDHGVHLVNSFGSFLFATFFNTPLNVSGDVKAKIRNSILYNSGYCIHNVEDDGYNLQFPAPAASCRTTIPVVDPKLDPEGLANNGGMIETVRPLGDSPAINAIPNALCTDLDGNPIMIDERVAAPLERPFFRPAVPGGPCDIGAIELQAQ